MIALRNHYSLLLVIALVVTLACNFGAEERTSSPGGSDQGRDVSEKNNENEQPEPEPTESDDVSEKIPDIDFPESSETEEEEPEESETPETSSGNRTFVVKFAKGGTSRSYKNAVVRGDRDTYVLSAAKGQKMSVRISAVEDNAVFYIRKPGGGYLGGRTETEPADNYSGTLPATGKYRIVVSGTRGNATYNIRFSVTGRPSSSNSTTIESRGGLTTVVRFKKGATSAAYRNAVIRAQSNKYILGAQRGQLMSVSISSLENNAVFRIQAPNGRVMAGERKFWSGQLPANGKYRISVSPTRGNATYTIRFAVR